MITIIFEVNENTELKEAKIKTTTLRSIESEPTKFEQKISDVVDDFVIYLGKNLSKIESKSGGEL